MNFLIGDQNPILKIPILKNEKVTALVWGIMDETVITGHEDGKIRQWDIRVSADFLPFLCV